MEIVRTPARRAALAGVALVAALGGGACGRPQSSSQGSAGTDSPEAAPASATAQVELGAGVQLDSGNAAYRAKDYARALTHYRAAAQRAPGLTAAWFGIYMAQDKLGNKAAADSAMKKVQELAPGMGAHPATGAAGATSAADGMPPAGSAGAGALPPGHPALPGAPKR